jgi:hypothetical protein
VRSHPDPRARRQLLRIFAKAPKWQAASLLLETLTDPDDDVRASASELVEAWVRTFNRSHVQPTAEQLQRIRTRLDAVAPQLSEDTVRQLRFTLAPR